MKCLFFPVVYSLESNLHGNTKVNGYTVYSEQIINLIAQKIPTIKIATDNAQVQKTPKRQVYELKSLNAAPEEFNRFWRKIFGNRPAINDSYSRDIFYRIFNFSATFSAQQLSCLLSKKWDLVFFNRHESFFFAALPEIKKAKKIFVVHDLMFERKASYKNKTKIVQPLEVPELGLELGLLAIADGFICINPKEVKTLKTLFPGVPIALIRPHIEIPSDFKQVFLRKDMRRKQHLSFIGVNNFVNRDTSEKVLKSVEESKIVSKVHFIGSICDHLTNNSFDSKKVVLHHYQDNPRDILKKTDFLFCPVGIGSGTPVKIAEALSYGVPVITTEFGATSFKEFRNRMIFIIKDTESLDEVLARIKFARIDRIKKAYQAYHSNALKSVSKLLKDV